MSALPTGWTQAALLNLATLNPKTEEQDSVSCGFAPMQALGTSFRTPLKFESRPWGDVKKAYTHFKNGDVLMAKVTPCFENGKAGIAANLPNGIGAGSSEFFVIRPSTDIDARYLLGWLSTEAFRKRAALAMTGSVGLKRVPKDLLQTEVIPVAPAAEQKRIADKLDTVLTRVDAVNTRLARVAPLLKRFRQSVLAAATSGRLTEDWRQSQPTVDEWHATTFGAIAIDLRYGTSKKCEAEGKGVAVLRIPNIGDDGQPDLHDLKFADFDDTERKKLSLQKGDLLVIRSNGSVDLVGKACVVNDRAEGLIFAGYLIRLRFDKTTVVPRFAFFALTAPEQRQRIEITAKSTSGVNNINSDELRSLPVNLPSLEEQTEIVRRVETLFAFADRLEARLAQAQAAATRLTPALLAKAFRGELVPQDPNDEPAAELLRRLAQATSAASLRKGRKPASAAV